MEMQQIEIQHLTGESKLVNVTKSKSIIRKYKCKWINRSKSRAKYENGTVSQILNLVENATDKKAKQKLLYQKLQKFIHQ